MFKGIIHSLKSLLKKPFKIGIITYYYAKKDKLENGVAIHTYYLSRELAKIGCEVHIFTRGEKNSIKKEYIDEGKIVIHRINTKFDSPLKDPVIKKRMSYFIFDNKVINEVNKENSHEKFNILHTHGWLTAGAFISKYFNDVKWIHTFHALEKNRLKFMTKDEKKYFQIAKWMESTINYSDALIAVSKNLKQEILKNYPIKKQKISYIPNGVDLKVFKPENIPQEDKKILYIGRFSLEKGIDLLPKIIEKIFKRNKKIKFEIVASDKNIPNSLNKTKEKIEKLMIQHPNRIIWHKEYINREELAKIYNECLIYIQPSRYEAFGLTLLEAMACGKAVICTNKGGMPEVVENAGIILPFNSNLFVKEILRLLHNHKLRERYGRRGIERVKSFKWNNIAKKTFDLYKTVSKEEKKQKNPKISVIVPVYNSEKYIKETINSILNQDFKDFELIIINDASTDNSSEIIKELAKKDKRIRIFTNKINKGRAGSVNVGFKYAKGEYITFSDSDDLFYPERLKKQTEFLDKNSEIDMIYGNMLKFYEDGKEETYDSVEFKNTQEPLLRLKKSAKSKEKFKEIFQALDLKKYIPGGSVMFKRKIIDSGIKMDENLRNSEDCDFNFQVIGKEYKIMKMPIITFKYRKHSNQKSGNQEKMKIATDYVLNKLRKGEFFN